MAKRRILFVPLMQKGHTNPLVGVLQRLQAEGHELAVYGTRRESIAAQFSRAEIQCSWFPLEGGEGESTASLRKTAQLRDRRRLLAWSALGINSALAEPSVADLRAAIDTFEPDVVCVDPLAYHAAVAAELEGVPWAAISPLMIGAADPAWPCLWMDVQTELQPTILQQMEARGVSNIRLHASEVVSPWLNTLFVTEAFAPRAWSGNQHSWYLGPSRPLGLRGDETEFPWARLRHDVPIVYVSGGGGQSLSFDPGVFLDICHSLDPDEAQFVCAVQGLFDESFVRRFPASSVVVRAAPQIELLEKHVAVAVTHGGVNTVTECLAHGRPMLVVPIAHEQPLQACAVEARGVGLAIDSADLTRGNCRDALQRLLRPSNDFSSTAGAIQESFAEDGAAAASRLIVELARTREKMLPSVRRSSTECL